MEYTYEQANLCVISSNSRAKVRGLPHTLSAEQWLNAFRYFQESCAVCKMPIRALNNLRMDHWIPIAYRGYNNPGTVVQNIIPLCQKCNNTKHAMWPDEWLEHHYDETTVLSIIKAINTYFMGCTLSRFTNIKFEALEKITITKSEFRNYKKCLYCRLRFIPDDRKETFCSESCMKHAYIQSSGYRNWRNKHELRGIEYLEKQLMHLNDSRDEVSWLVWDYFD